MILIVAADSSFLEFVDKCQVCKMLLISRTFLIAEGVNIFAFLGSTFTVAAGVSPKGQDPKVPFLIHNDDTAGTTRLTKTRYSRRRFLSSSVLRTHCFPSLATSSSKRRKKARDSVAVDFS